MMRSSGTPPPISNLREWASIVADGEGQKNDGTTIYKLSAKDVAVDGFWSISAYNAKGYFVNVRSR